MGADVYAKFPAAAKVLDEIDEFIGYKLTTVCFYGPDETLKATNITQPALYATSVATLAALTENGISCAAAAGHSVGEYAALVAAGALNMQAGLSLVSQRGTIMQKYAEATPGAMAAVLGLSGEQVVQICKETESAGNGIVDAANINGAGQVVISGEHAAVEAAGALAKERGAKRVIPLAVSGAFHSRLMTPAAEEMRRFLTTADFSEAKIPVVANVTADFEASVDDIRENLALQIDHSVLWEQSIQRLLSDGFDTFVEVGSGTVLTGLMKRISKEVAVYSTNDADELEATILALQ